MAQFWVFSNFFREKCYENDDTKQLCQTIAAKYMESEKQELRAQNAREENIILKMDVANFESVCRTVTENGEAQAELDILLKDFYEEHLKATFDIDECEMEKLFGYEEIKIELESRESVNVFQQFYSRKIKMATRMEERQIVKKYRQKEQEFLKTEAERESLEEHLNKLRKKANEEKAREKEMCERILRLVKGSKELEDIYSRQESVNRLSQIRTIKIFKPPQQPSHKGGLSSRLLLNFNQFEIPSVAISSKVRAINPAKGFSRLLEQAEVLRKSMHSSTLILSDNTSIPSKLPSILKIQTDFAKSPDVSHKTVSFKAELEENSASGSKFTGETPTVSIVAIDSTVVESTNDSESKNSKSERAEVHREAGKFEILENIIIKPADGLQSISDTKAESDRKSNTKRKVIEEDHNYAADSPPKKGRIEKLDSSFVIESKGFMDMFLNLSKQTPMTVTSSVDTQKKLSPADEKKSEVKEKPEKVIKRVIKNEEGNENKKKAKKSKDSFEDFDDFFSGFAGSGSDNDNSEAEMSFDFLKGMENTNEEGPAEANTSFSFQF